MATTYNTAFGSLPGYNEMLGTTNTTGGGQQQTYQPSTATTTTTTTTAAPAAGPVQQAPSPTFRDMQAAGQARPAPPTTPTPAFTGTLTDQLKQQLGTFLQQPGRFGTQEFQQIRKAQAENLQAEYGAQQKALNEELARRGLSASSVGGGRMGDLAGQQSRALASLDATLLEKAAGYGAEDLRTKLEAIGLLQKGSQVEQELGLKRGELTGTVGGEETLAAKQFRQQLEEQRANRLQQLGISTRDLDLEAERIQNEAKAQGRSLDLQQARDEAEIQARVKQLEQQARLEGRSLDLQEARDRASREIEIDRLKAQERQFEATMSAEDRRFNASIKEQQESRLQQLGISTRELDLQAIKIKQDGELQGKTLSLQEARDEAEIQYRVKQLDQQARLEGRSLDLQEARDKASREIEVDRLAAEDRRFDATLTADERKFNASLEEQKAARLQQLGISTRDLDLEALKIKQDGELQGKSLTIQQARDEAEIQYRSKQLEQQAKLEGRALDLQEARDVASREIERDKLVAQERQFESTLTAEERRFNASIKEQQENRLQQLGISTRELDLQALKIKQESELQGRSLTLQQARDEAEIQYRVDALAQEAQLQGRSLDLQQARDLAEQTFREDTLKEQTAARLQQFGISTKQLDEEVRRNKATETLQGRTIDNEKLYRDAELKLRAEQLQKDAANQGRAMDIDEARIAAQKSMQAEELKFNREDLEERRRQFGARLAEDKRQADLDRQLRQLLGMTEVTGTVYEAGADGTVRATENKTLAALRENLERAQVMSAITGKQYTIDPNTGRVVTASTEKTEAARQADLDRNLRQVLGLSEVTGFVYDPVTGQRTSTETVQGQIARSQTLLALANALGNLTPEQIAQLLGRGVATTTQGGDRSGTPTTSSAINPKDGDTKMEGGKTYVYRGTWPNGQWVETGSATTTTTGDTKPTQSTTTTTRAPDTPTTQSPYAGWNPEVDMLGYVNQASLLQTPLKSLIESGTDLNSIIGTRYKVGGYYVFYDGSGWKAIPAAG